MTTFAVTTVKDELDILPYTLEHMLTQVDGVIVADNGSTDGTRDMLAEMAQQDPRIVVQDDAEIAYYQSARMSRLAQQAAGLGASWVVAWDADEYWYSPFGRVADVLADSPGAVSKAALYDRVPTAVDDANENPVRRIAYRRRDPAPLPKVACRPNVPARIEQGNHGAHYDTGAEDGLLVVFHYPYRSPEQMVRKARNGAAAYAATTLPDHEGAHWRQYGMLTDEQLGDVFRQYFWSAEPLADNDLIFDPAP